MKAIAVKPLSYNFKFYLLIGVESFESANGGDEKATVILEDEEFVEAGGSNGFVDI